MSDSNGKGKGKAASAAQPSSSASQHSTFSLPIPSARDLASLLSAGGKGPPGHVSVNAGTAAAAAAHEWSADARASLSGGDGETNQSFRTDVRGGGERGKSSTNDAAYQDFASQAHQAQPEVSQRQAMQVPLNLLVGPYASASALDPGLHASTRASMRQEQPSSYAYVPTTQAEAFQAAWHSLDGTTTAPQDMGAAWARVAPQTSSFHVEPEEAAAEEASFDDFMAALAMDEAKPASMTSPAPLLAAQSLPSGLTNVWRPPSPSQRGELTLEQFKLHQDLAILQDDELRTLPPPAPSTTTTTTSRADAHLNALGSRAAQNLVPPSDDATARTGVYASTPEDAFRAIWHGPATAERARQEREQGVHTVNQEGQQQFQSTIEESFAFQNRASKAINDITMWIARGTYVDDVYGLPPLLTRTISDADRPASTDAEAEAVRLRAVERLELILKHLSVSTLYSVHEAESLLRRQHEMP